MVEHDHGDPCRYDEFACSSKVHFGAERQRLSYKHRQFLVPDIRQSRIPALEAGVIVWALIGPDRLVVDGEWTMIVLGLNDGGGGARAFGRSWNLAMMLAKFRVRKQAAWRAALRNQGVLCL